MELKWKKGLELDALSDLAKEALSQIDAKRYDTVMREVRNIPVLKFGIAFSGKNVRIETKR